MKKIKKLSLKKESISNLEEKEMSNLKGGTNSGMAVSCPAYACFESKVSYCPGSPNYTGGSGGGNYTVGCPLSANYCP